MDNYPPLILPPVRRADHFAVQEWPPQAYFIVSAVFHYLGPAFAVLLFGVLEPLGLAWLRIAFAAAVFVAWRRPARLRATLETLDHPARRLLVAWGVVLAVMNSSFYLALDRLPLGTVAAIEFLPIVALAAFGARTWRNGAALALAVFGVSVLTEIRLMGEPVGFGLAFVNAGLFALYVMLGHRVAQRGGASGIDGLAVAMLVAAVVATPIGAWVALPHLGDPVVLLAGLGVAVTSSVIPYVTDQLAMSRLRRSTYALLLSLLPATATVIGILVLAQVPTIVEVAGVVLIMGAVGLHRMRDAR